MHFPALETDRLRLREIVADDAAAVFAIHGDAAHMQWFGTEPQRRIEDAAELIETFAAWRNGPSPGILWGIERRADGELLGTCGLFKWNRTWRSSALGYELAAQAQGHGYMREALRAVLAYGFAERRLNRIEAVVHPQNRRSIALLSALGFVQEGTLREGGYWSGRHHDLLQFGLLAREYASARADAA